MGKKEHAGVFFYPYAKYMFGKQTYSDMYLYNEVTQMYEEDEYEIDMNNFSLGFGLGYKWVFSEKYSLGLDLAIGRTFNQDIADYFSQVEFKSGVNFGIRF